MHPAIVTELVRIRHEEALARASRQRLARTLRENMPKQARRLIRWRTGASFFPRRKAKSPFACSSPTDRRRPIRSTVPTPDLGTTTSARVDQLS